MLYRIIWSGTLAVDGWVVQQGGAWAGCGPAQSPPRCAKWNRPPINGQCTNHCIAIWWSAVLKWQLKGYMYLLAPYSNIARHYVHCLLISHKEGDVFQQPAHAQAATNNWTWLALELPAWLATGVKPHQNAHIRNFSNSYIQFIQGSLANLK